MAAANVETLWTIHTVDVNASSSATLFADLIGSSVLTDWFPGPAAFATSRDQPPLQAEHVDHVKEGPDQYHPATWHR